MKKIQKEKNLSLILSKTGMTGQNGCKLLLFTNSYDLLLHFDVSVLKYTVNIHILTFGLILSKTGKTDWNGHKLLLFTDSCDWLLRVQTLYAGMYVKSVSQYLVFYLSSMSTVTTSCVGRSCFFCGLFFSIFLV